MVAIDGTNSKNEIFITIKPIDTLMPYGLKNIKKRNNEN